jgi:hypothetical protein
MDEESIRWTFWNYHFKNPHFAITFDTQKSNEEGISIASKMEQQKQFIYTLDRLEDTPWNGDHWTIYISDLYHDFSIEILDALKNILRRYFS